MLKMFLVSLTLTIVIELVVALIYARISGSISFIHKPRGILLIILINILTNPPAVFLYWLASRWLSNAAAFAVQLLIEAAVVAVEAEVYHNFSKEDQWKIHKPFLLSLSANVTSWLCGVVLTVIKIF